VIRRCAQYVYRRLLARLFQAVAVVSAIYTEKFLGPISDLHLILCLPDRLSNRIFKTDELFARISHQIYPSLNSL